MKQLFIVEYSFKLFSRLFFSDLQYQKRNCCIIYKKIDKMEGVDERRFTMANDQIRKIAIAIYTVNRHAKTATDNKELYQLKKISLEKLIQDGNAKKIGLHFTENAKYSKQHSTTLVQCKDFLFHTIPEKKDFKTLPHLGHQNHSSRNPQERMSLRTARTILHDFVGYVQPEERPRRKTNRHNARRKSRTPSGFRSSYLDG